MITPNKFTPLDQSILAKLSVILKQEAYVIPLRELYRSVSNSFENVDQFLLAIDVLYVLGKINVDFETEMVSYVD